MNDRLIVMEKTGFMKDGIIFIVGQKKRGIATLKSLIKNRMPNAKVMVAEDIQEGLQALHKNSDGIVITDQKIFTSLLSELTENKRKATCLEVENQLKACEERYRELLNSMKIGVIIYETHDNGETFTIKDLNRGAEAIERVKGSDVIGRRVDHVFPGIHRFGLIEVLKRVYRTGTPEHHPIALYTDERIEGWRDNYLYRLPSGEIVTVYTDETERKQAEYALQKSEERYRNIFENISEGIFQTTPDGRYLLVNPALASMYGFESPEEMKNTVKDIQQHYVNPEDRVRFKRLIESQGYVKGFEASQYHRDGSTIWISINAHVVRDEKGNVLYYEGTAKNITMRKKTERELLEQQEQLRALSTRLVEIEETERRRISQELHDSVGQNLTALSINLNIIASQLQDATEAVLSRLKDSLIIIEQTTEKIRDVMSDLRPSVLDDYGLLAGLRWYGRLYSLRTGIDITVDGDDPPERPSVSVENALFRISQEALTNIAKHSGATEVLVRLKVKNSVLQLSIEDNGKGFDMEEVAHYNRDIKKTMNREGYKEKRIKWGLTTMRERAISVKGNIRIESQKGKGTKVIVDVPLS
ncbi:MAG: PAS domain S-box protein [Syntrophorhabdaceae bacterium]|nr:PAS domain S-box protein [Syntrophorhabdaceae bacterium]